MSPLIQYKQHLEGSCSNAAAGWQVNMVSHVHIPLQDANFNIFHFFLTIWLFNIAMENHIFF